MIDTAEIILPQEKQVKAKVHRELVNILFNQIKHMLWAEAFGATLMLYILWWHGDADRGLLLGWYSYMILITGLPRYLITKAYARSMKNHAEERSSSWERAIIALLFISALGWGFAGTALLPNSGMYQAFVLFLLVGIAATANPFYSPIKKAYAIFLLPTLLFVACFLLLKDSSSNWHVFAGLALLSFGILMLTTSIVSSELINTTLIFRFQNAQLSENLLKANKTLAKLATHDTLTGLPNRQFFNERLAQAIANAKQKNHHFALMFMDIDKFKWINDTLGHDIGDQLLIAIADRLNRNLDSECIVARLGGDEFMILHENMTKEKASALAEKICQLLAQPLQIKNHDIFITTSIGISFYPADAKDEETLMQHADIAMYQIKNRGGNNHIFYDPKMQGDVEPNKKD